MVWYGHGWQGFCNAYYSASYVVIIELGVRTMKILHALEEAAAAAMLCAPEYTYC